MKTAITRLLNRQISHATFDLRLAQGACFATAVVMLVLSVAAELVERQANERRRPRDTLSYKPRLANGEV
jgi:hypothetical protein